MFDLLYLYSKWKFSQHETWWCIKVTSYTSDVILYDIKMALQWQGWTSATSDLWAKNLTEFSSPFVTVNHFKAPSCHCAITILQTCNVIWLTQAGWLKLGELHCKTHNDFQSLAAGSAPYLATTWETKGSCVCVWGGVIGWVERVGGGFTYRIPLLALGSWEGSM